MASVGKRARAVQSLVNNAQKKIIVTEEATQKHPDAFAARHIGPRKEDTKTMLESLGLKTLEEFIAKTIPSQIRVKQPVQLSEDALSEQELLARAEFLASQNDLYTSYIGMGYHDTITPPVIVRNVIENPGWTTSYTPYQPEISQGRLECLLNYQTMVQSMTGLPIANASLLDEGTAAAEALGMALKTYPKKKKFFVDENCHPQTIAIVKTRADAFEVEVEVGPVFDADVSSGQYCGVLFQYPDTRGDIQDFRDVVSSCAEAGSLSICATDLLALTVLEPPGSWGCDVALGNSQRFGVPLGHGGPHAAFFAVKDEHVRRLPGRLIGVSVDANGNRALRLTLTTREQHIRRDKATSNICTAQALLANVAAMYAIYHGPQGLGRIAGRVHGYTRALAYGLESAGYTLHNSHFFDTLTVNVSSKLPQVLTAAKANRINLRLHADGSVGVALDETVTMTKLETLLQVFASPVVAQDAWDHVQSEPYDLTPFARSESSPVLPHSVFNSYHSEPLFTRYIKMLENKDTSLVHSMVPLGSCTMKLNATAEMVPITMRGFNGSHPFVPREQIKGSLQLFKELEQDLEQITGLDKIDLQPNSGAQGEYTGLRIIRAYQKAIGEGHRNVCVIPRSAHGTNPASAQMAGLRVVPVDTDSHGNVSAAEVAKVAEKHGKTISSLLLTYPSTFGVFEEQIGEVADVAHHYGAQLYIDGANMNAQVGLCRPGDYGADVIHLNLHKTFCIPHGGGGPGVGPVGVKKHLIPFLPSHPILSPYPEATHPFGTIAAAPWGSASILPISWAYLKMMGSKGVKRATEIALLNANYMRVRLQDAYDVLYTGTHGMCAHEFIIDIRPLKKKCGVEANDIAKRLMDYGFHAPTMSWPVANTLMVEPTESEDLAELDRYIQALLSIRQEIRDVEEGRIKLEESPLKHAPHTCESVCGSTWNRAYSRETAAFPAPFVLPATKHWPTVGRLNDSYGDMNLNCSCDPVDY